MLYASYGTFESVDASYTNQADKLHSWKRCLQSCPRIESIEESRDLKESIFGKDQLNTLTFSLNLLVLCVLHGRFNDGVIAPELYCC